MNDSKKTLVNHYLAVSQIFYDCDLRLPEDRSSRIPLGVIAELSLPHIRCLALMGRKVLGEHELARVDELSARLITSPYGWLSECFDDAWDNTTPAGALPYLARKHSWSLRFDAPNKRLMASDNLDPDRATRAEITSFMVDLLDHEFVQLLNQRQSPRTQLIELDDAA